VRIKAARVIDDAGLHAYTGLTMPARRSRGGDAMEIDPGRVDTGVDESGDYDVGLDDHEGLTPPD
jgi:hypothetical protein